MDNAMVKRGIGAVVLAIIAALLLGYLLKDKSRERQEVVDIKLPDAPEMKIPSLGNAMDKVSDGAATLVENTKEKAVNAGNSVVAAASGTANSIKESVSNASGATNNKPGFAIRPPQPGETREIVDSTTPVLTQDELPIKVDTGAEKTTDKVVASSRTEKKKPSFKPHIVEKKKPAKPVKKKAPKPTIVAKKEKPAEKKPNIAAAPIPNQTSISSKPLGKYSIQLLATSSQSRANKLAKTMQSEGYKIFITQTTRNNKILYRVRVGGHADRNSALKAQEGMKKRYKKNFFVQNSLVISN